MPEIMCHGARCGKPVICLHLSRLRPFASWALGDESARAGLAMGEGDQPVMWNFGRGPFDAFQFFAFQLPCAVLGSLLGTLAAVAILQALGA